MIRHTCVMIVIAALMLSCCSLSKPAYLKEFAPGTQIPGHGVSFTIPNEEDWCVFDPDGKGGMIGKTGRNEHESYIITLDYYRVPPPQSDEEFTRIYEKVKGREVSSPRYVVRTTREESDHTRGRHCLLFYYLVEDHGVRNMPPGQQYMLLETTGYFAVHPDDPNLTVRVAYSYRYSPGHEDQVFKEKAKWVLDQTRFTKP